MTKLNYGGIGASGGGLPAGYEYKKNPTTGALQIWQGSNLISEQDRSGMWVSMSVTTGTGSFHLGGIHSIGSGGENVIFENEQSGITFYPVWQGLNGNDDIAATQRVHGASFSQEVNNPGASPVGRPMSVKIDITRRAMIRTITIRPRATHLKALVKLYADNVEILAFNTDITFNSGNNTLDVNLRYPVWLNANDEFKVEIFDTNDVLITVDGTASGAYLRVPYREWTDYPVISSHNPAENARSLETLTGNERLSVLSLKDTDKLNQGIYRGPINFSGGLSQFTGVKGDFWQADTAGTIGGRTLNVGDKLLLTKNQNTTPTDLLTDYVVQQNVAAIATANTVGVAKFGNGLQVDSGGNVTARVANGVMLNGNTIEANPAQIDVTQLKNYGTLSKGEYKGDIPSTLAGLANAKKGWFWKAATAKTLSGTSFAAGDELYCMNDITGTPADLSNFAKVANVSAAMIGATSTAGGQAGTVPVPQIGDNAKFLAGDATYKLPTDLIANGAITTPMIANKAVTTALINDAAVGTTQIADNSITSGKIANGAVGADDLASNSVTTVKITDANVTTAKLADNAVTAAKLASDAVTTAKILDANVTTAKIADNNVTTAKIPDNAITTAKLNNGAVTAAKIANNAVITDAINNSAVMADKIASGAVTTDKIAFNAVTTDKIVNANVTTAKIADSAVTFAKTSGLQTSLDYEGSAFIAAASRDIRYDFSSYVWQSVGAGTIAPSQIPLVYPTDAAARQMQAVYLLQRYLFDFMGTENDSHYDQITSSQLRTSIIPNGNMRLSTTDTDVDNQSGTTLPTEYFKLVLGSDGSNIYYLSVCLNFPTITSGAYTIPTFWVYNTATAAWAGINSFNTTNFAPTSVTSLTDTISPGLNNNGINTSTAALILQPIVLQMRA